MVNILKNVFTRAKGRKIIVSAKLLACIYFLLTEHQALRGFSYQERNKKRNQRPNVGGKAGEGPLPGGDCEAAVQ